MGFFGYSVVCHMGWSITAWSLNDVHRDSYVHPLQFRHPEASFSYCPGRNFSEKLEVVWVDLLKHCKGASGPYEVDAPGCRVILDFVGAAHAVQHLHHFPRFRIHNHQLSRFVLVFAFYPAANKQAMMDWVQTRGMGQRPSSDWPLGDYGT